MTPGKDAGDPPFAARRVVTGGDRGLGFGHTVDFRNHDSFDPGIEGSLDFYRIVPGHPDNRQVEAALMACMWPVALR